MDCAGLAVVGAVSIGLVISAVIVYLIHLCVWVHEGKQRIKELEKDHLGRVTFGYVFDQTSQLRTELLAEIDSLRPKKRK